MVSVKDYYNVIRLQFKKNKVKVIGNVIEYQPFVGQFTTHNMVQPSITTSLVSFIDRNDTFLLILWRLDLNFTDLMLPVSSNMDVTTGESSKLNT